MNNTTIPSSSSSLIRSPLFLNLLLSSLSITDCYTRCLHNGEAIADLVVFFTCEQIQFLSVYGLTA
ncbi:unnamed protein product [Citrullus colocynthis]|uniref:Secreted protein n=1 Tax=Citrullus colocynthis TaxID=252529 RepID=A0ABP0YAC8_9ROSI